MIWLPHCMVLEYLRRVKGQETQIYLKMSGNYIK
jgi:hypothetical protein